MCRRGCNGYQLSFCHPLLDEMVYLGTFFPHFVKKRGFVESEYFTMSMSLLSVKKSFFPLPKLLVEFASRSTWKLCSLVHGVSVILWAVSFILCCFLLLLHWSFNYIELFFTVSCYNLTGRGRGRGYGNRGRGRGFRSNGPIYAAAGDV